MVPQCFGNGHPMWARDTTGYFEGNYIGGLCRIAGFGGFGHAFLKPTTAPQLVTGNPVMPNPFMVDNDFIGFGCFVELAHNFTMHVMDRLTVIDHGNSGKRHCVKTTHIAGLAPPSIGVDLTDEFSCFSPLSEALHVNAGSQQSPPKYTATNIEPENTRCVRTDSQGLCTAPLP